MYSVCGYRQCTQSVGTGGKAFRVCSRRSTVSTCIQRCFQQVLYNANKNDIDDSEIARTTKHADPYCGTEMKVPNEETQALKFEFASPLT